MKEKNEEILYISPIGMEFICHRYKHKACIHIKHVSSKMPCYIFRFANVPFYKHPYLSWENLDCCGKWAFNKTYLESCAVQNHKKLVAEIKDVTMNTTNIDKWADTLKFDLDQTDTYKKVVERTFGRNINILIVSRKGCLGDFFKLEEILHIYELHGITKYDLGKMKTLWYIPLIELFSQAGVEHGFDYDNIKTVEDSIINGLAFGYPIESTVGFINKEIIFRN